MKYIDKYNELRKELWNEFQSTVRTGAKLPTLVSTVYPIGINPPNVSKDTDGQSWFYAKEIVKDEKYQLHIGEDIIVDTNKIKIIDTDNQIHEIEPDTLDLHWISEILDAKTK
jgi:hypothetical protein